MRSLAEAVSSADPDRAGLHQNGRRLEEGQRLESNKGTPYTLPNFFVLVQIGGY